MEIYCKNNLSSTVCENLTVKVCPLIPANTVVSCSKLARLPYLLLKVYNNNYYDTKYFITLFERALIVMKNGFYFILITLLVAELREILIYKN